MVSRAGGTAGERGGTSGGTIRTLRVVLLGMIVASSLFYVQFVTMHHQDTLTQLRTTNSLKDMDNFKNLPQSQSSLSSTSSTFKQRNEEVQTNGNEGGDADGGGDTATTEAAAEEEDDERTKEEDNTQGGGGGGQSNQLASGTEVDEETGTGGEETTSDQQQAKQQQLSENDADQQEQQRSMLRKPQGEVPPPNVTSTAKKKPVMINDKITTSNTSKTIFILCLLIISGIMESIGNRRFGCHPNMMTGNTVKCMDALSLNNFDMVLKLAVMIANYVAGSFVYGIIKHSISITFRIPILVCVARFSFFGFVLSDMIVRGYFVSSSSSSRPTTSSTAGSNNNTKTSGYQSKINEILRLGVMSLSFGLLNASANAQVGMVTNAVTKHWTDFGLGATEMMLLGDVSNAAWSTSGAGVLVFLLSLYATNVAQCKLEYLPEYKSKLPPLGTTLGIMYYLLFTWYSSQQLPVPT